MDSDAGPDFREKTEALLENPSTRFNLASLPAFTAHLDLQMKDSSLYSLANNVAILKIYLLYPSENDLLVLQKILILALTQLPSPDFTVCHSQIPLHFQGEEPVAKLVNLHSLLQNCNFVRFWELARMPLESLDGGTILEVDGVVDSVRRFILEILPLAYHQLAVPEMRRLLDFAENSREFEDVVALFGWSFDDAYDRADPESGLCLSLVREDTLKTQKATASQNLDRLLKPEPMRHYYTTLHS